MTNDILNGLTILVFGRLIIIVIIEAIHNSEVNDENEE